MRLVERRDALVTIEIRGVGHAIVLTADNVGPGERRVVDAARQGVGRLGLPSVRHALAERCGERVVGGFTDRFEHVDPVERRIDAAT